MRQGKTLEEKKTLTEEIKLDHRVQNHMEFNTEPRNLEENKKSDMEEIDEERHKSINLPNTDDSQKNTRTGSDPMEMSSRATLTPGKPNQLLARNKPFNATNRVVGSTIKPSKSLSSNQQDLAPLNATVQPKRIQTLSKFVGGASGMHARRNSQLKQDLAQKNEKERAAASQKSKET